MHPEKRLEKKWWKTGGFSSRGTLPPMENGPQKETKVIFQAPIFHFHDYGRKGTFWIKNHQQKQLQVSPSSWMELANAKA